ncbi:hypothetical protein SUGI_0140120 [Cryptomeria japonica]|nr:hypothetical protein SUGI_0140120 [Cryptomeria japonica]
MERHWNLMKISGYKLMDKKQNRANIVWTPPTSGNFKINFNGASRGNLGKSGYGAIIRNEFGNFVGANYDPLGINTNNMVEMTGLLAGLEWCVARGIQDIEVEGDLQIILNGISKQNFENWKLEVVRPKIQRICESLNKFTFKHIYREGNSAADWLANSEYVYDSIGGLVGITLNSNRHWCDALVLEAVLLPLADIIERKERVVKLLVGFIKPFIADIVAEAILEEEEEESEDDDIEKGDDIESSEGGDEAFVNSEEIHDMAHREVWREEQERLKTFGDEAWEIFRCDVFNGNMEPFRRITESDDWWLPESSTCKAIAIGEYAAMIYQAIGGQM